MFLGFSTACSGVYLYGSLTQRAFDARRSDVDGIVVTRRVLTASEFRALATWLRQPVGAAASAVVSARDARPHDECSGVPLSVRAADARQLRWQSHHLDEYACEWTGPPRTPARSFVPPIARSMLVEALDREVGYLRHELAKPRSKWRNGALGGQTLALEVSGARAARSPSAEHRRASVD